MIKNFYISIIPIGISNWRDKVKSLILTANLNDSAYKCWRLFDTLDASNYAKLEDLPMFIPNEAIKLEGDIKFRIAVSYPIRDEDIYLSTPWNDEEVPYKEACWSSIEKIVEQSSDYVIILKPSYCFQETKKDIDRIVKDVVEICSKYKKSYLVIENDDSISFKNIYESFNSNN